MTMPKVPRTIIAELALMAALTVAASAFTGKITAYHAGMFALVSA